MDRPFVYISALMRTGSTVLSEALTQLPESFIFHETHLGKNTFSLSAPDQQQLIAYGVDVAAFLRMRLAVAFILRRLRTIRSMQDYMIKEVKRGLVPTLRDAGLLQIGIKEIKHEGWQHYVRHFPDLKMVMIGRDPRDIYISAYRKWQLGTTQWPGPFTPDLLADELSEQFHRQMRMRACVDFTMVRYEELCLDPHVLQRVLSFVNSPVEEMGEIGRFLGSHHKRFHEHLLHGSELSQRRVNRWRREKDKRLLTDAHEFAARMSAYNTTWQYV